MASPFWMQELIAANVYYLYNRIIIRCIIDNYR